MHLALGKSHKQARILQRIVYGIFALAALAMVLVSTSAWAQGAGYWHTSGNKIVDANGDTVRIAGINWYGAETPDYIVHGLWAQDYHTVLNTIKSLGYNVIRIPFSNQLVESNPVPTNYSNYVNGPVNQALVGQTALADLDTIIAYAGSIGLRVILDNHRSEAGETNEASGLWYTSAYPQANWIADWKTMATRYSASTFTFNGNPTVIGMDLRNEPHLSGSGATTGSCWTGDTATNGCPTSLTAQNWPVAAEAASNAILAVNSKLLIFVEGNDCYSGVCGWQGGNLIGVANYPVKLNVANQLVYSAHDYGPNLYQQSWFNSSTTPASLDAIWNKYWGYISAAGTAPVWLGEFGTDNTSTDIENSAAGSQGQWFESLVSFLQNNPSIDWTYWALNGEDSYGLLDGSYDATPVSSLKQSELASIQFPLSGGSTTPTFTLASSPSTLSITQGSTATDTITVTDVDGFSGSVTFTTSGMPSGVTAAFSPTSSTSSSVLTLTASSTATTGGPVTVTVTGTSGSTTATTTIALTVNAKVTTGFTLSPSASSLTVKQGSSGTDTITVTDVGGFTGSVAFTASGMPSGVTAAFSPTSSATSSVLTLTATSTATTGAFTITVTGTSGSTTATTTFTLNVSSASSFTLAPSPATLSITQGKTATDTITVTDVGGFTGSVTLAASNLPSGVTVAYGTNPTTSTSVLTFTASSTATVGTATVTITGTSGSTTATTTIALTVSPSGGGACEVDYTISPQNSSQFGAAINIKNNGSTTLSGWSLTWTFANGQTIASSWNGTVSQSGANVTVSEQSGQSWENIPAGGSYSGFVFNGTWNGTTNAIPTAFSLNGTACTVN